MFTRKFRPLYFTFFILQMALTFAPAQTSPTNDWKPVEAAMERTGQISGEVIRFGMPRKDLHVTLDGIEIKPSLALGSWAAFKKDGNAAMVMGDLVLIESEVQPVISKLQEGGIQESAVHNHLIGESPRILYVHIVSHGDAVQMANALRSAIAETHTPPPDAAAPPSTGSDLGFDQKQVEQALGHTGKVNGGVLQVSVPRSETIKDSGMTVPPSMGVATSLNFQSTSSGKAAVTGDFVLLNTEVNPVMKALRRNGIAVTAVHSHMLMEEPRLFFMHFWAHDDPVKLARALRAALDQTNSAK